MDFQLVEFICGVLVDTAKHECSKKVFVVDIWMNELLFSVKCLTDAGEFVLTPETTLC